jgi:hypothetical protein
VYLFCFVVCMYTTYALALLLLSSWLAVAYAVASFMLLTRLCTLPHGIDIAAVKASAADGTTDKERAAILAAAHAVATTKPKGRPSPVEKVSTRKGRQ